MIQHYEYVIIGGGIAGCSIAYELSKVSKSVVIVDQHSVIAGGASGAAGAFLSPLLGKPNRFKDLVNCALVSSLEFYKTHCPSFIDNCGTLRIPKNKEDEEKFHNYIPYIEFPYQKKEDGYFFQIGSVVRSSEICRFLAHDVIKILGKKVSAIRYQEERWLIDGTISASNLILATGADLTLLPEDYIDIRPVWGQRIDIETSTPLFHNYHKECSLGRTTLLENKKYKTSIGATHHRFVLDREVSSEDTQELLFKANMIRRLEDVRVVKLFGGARASSNDYFPLLGSLIDKEATLLQFPYLKNGTHVDPKRFTRYPRLFIYNGVGGRGFVFAPYLAKLLAGEILANHEMPTELQVDRMFVRSVKRAK